MIKKELTGGEWKALKNNKTRSELVEKLTIVILQDTIRPSRSKSSFTTHVLHLLFVYRKNFSQRLNLERWEKAERETVKQDKILIL